MLLVLTNSSDATADYLITRLPATSFHHVRIDTDKVLKTAQIQFDNNLGQLTIDGMELTAAEITNIWYRRPEPISPAGVEHSPEAIHLSNEWSEAIEGFLCQVPHRLWMNHPSSNIAASHKTEQLARANRLGFRTPSTIVTQSATTLRHFWDTHSGRIIVKPLSSGRVKHVGEGEDRAIYTSRVDATHLKQADLLKACPALFQEEIDKRLDIRICVVETCIHAVGLSRRVGMNQALDIRRDNMSDVVHGEISLPSQIKSHVLSLTRSYGLRFAAIDMAIDSDGNWVFFEVNPNGQWAWMDLLGVTNIAESFVRAFSAESPRCA